MHYKKVGENMKKKIRSMYIDDKFWEMLKNISKDNKRSMSNMIEVLIEKYFNENK